jgi:hypothetical protein
MKEVRHKKIVFMILGMIEGYVIIHLYTMLSYALLKNRQHLILDF